jgi:Flp pilus assembly pilin Flp
MNREMHIVSRGRERISERAGMVRAHFQMGLARAVGGLSAFRQDVRGFAAVEFAFVAPIILFLLIGAVEITRAASIDRRFSVVTNMVADLVARETQLTSGDVDAIYDIVEQVMAPYDAAPLKLSIIPVMSSTDDANRSLVYPSTANRPSYHGGALPEKCQSYPLARGLLSTNESVIVVESSYEFTPLFVGYVLGSRSWTETAIAKPRKSLCVAFDGTTCQTSCFSS